MIRTSTRPLRRREAAKVHAEVRAFTAPTRKLARRVQARMPGQRNTRYAGLDGNRHDRRRYFRTRLRIRQGGGAGGGGGDPGDDVLLYEFDRLNPSGSSSPSNGLFGLMFKRGDLPTGSALVIKDTSDTEIRAGFAYRSLSPVDDSVHCLHVGLDDSAIAGSGSKTYRAYCRASSSFDDTSPGTSLTAILAAHDFKCELTDVVARYEYYILFRNGDADLDYPGFVKTGYTIDSVQHYDGNGLLNPAAYHDIVGYTITNGSGTTFQGQTGFDGFNLELPTPATGDYYVRVRLSWQHMSGTAFMAFTDGNTGTRVEKVISTPTVERWKFWAYIKDGATGTGTTDTHLKIYGHITRHSNPDGSEKALFCTAVPALEEVTVANKTGFTYTLTFKDGSDTLDTYDDVQHHYRGTWATVRLDDDVNHARARCIEGSDCSLITGYDKDYYQAVECFFPLNPTATPTSLNYIANPEHYNFVPGSAQGQNFFIDAGGEGAARGLFPVYGMIAYMNPSGINSRIDRVNSMASLHVAYHYRPALGNGPTVPYVLRMDNDLGSDTVTRWNADGLPNATYLSSDSRPSTDNNSVGYQFPASSAGPWILSDGASHAHAYGSWNFFAEGEEFMRQSEQDLFTNLAIQKVGDVYGNRRALQWSGLGGGYTGFSGLGIPTTQWSSTYVIEGAQERSTAWTQSIANWVAGLAPDGFPETPYLRGLNSHAARYIEKFLSYTPANHRANGVLYVREELASMWQQQFIAHQHCRAKRLFGYQGFVDMVAHIGNFVVSQATGSLMKNIAYHGCTTLKATPYHPSTNDFITTAGHNLTCMDSAYDLSTNVFTYTTFDDSLKAVRSNMIQNNDVVYFSSTLNDGFGGTSVPPGLSEGVPYYVINRANSGVGSITFQLSTSQGGSAVDMTGSSGTGACCPMVRFLGSDGGPGTAPVASDYPKTALCGLIMCHEAGVAGATDALIDTFEAWMSNLDYESGNNVRWSVERTP